MLINYLILRLMNVEQYVEQMNEIQRKWVYLEPIFSRDSVPSETSRFARVDVEFRSILEGLCMIACLFTHFLH